MTAKKSQELWDTMKTITEAADRKINILVPNIVQNLSPHK